MKNVDNEKNKLLKKLAKQNSQIREMNLSIKELQSEIEFLEREIEWYKSELLRINKNLTTDYYYEKMIFNLTDSVGFSPPFEFEGKKNQLYRNEGEKIDLKTLLFRVISGIGNPPKFLKDIINSQKAAQKLSLKFDSDEFAIFYKKYLDHRSETSSNKTTKQKKRK